MKYGKVLILVLTSLQLAAGVSGCATLGAEDSQNVAAMKSGMSESKVLSLLGTPDSIVSNGNHDRWIYEFKSSANHGHNLYVDFTNGALTQAGELSVRDLAAADEHRVSGACTRRQHPEMMTDSLCIK